CGFCICLIFHLDKCESTLPASLAIGGNTDGYYRSGFREKFLHGLFIHAEGQTTDIQFLIAHYLKHSYSNYGRERKKATVCFHMENPYQYDTKSKYLGSLKNFVYEFCNYSQNH